MALNSYTVRDVTVDCSLYVGMKKWTCCYWQVQVLQAKQYPLLADPLIDGEWVLRTDCETLWDTLETLVEKNELPTHEYLSCMMWIHVWHPLSFTPWPVLKLFVPFVHEILWYQIMLDKQELSRSRSRRSPINCCVSFSFKHSTEAIRNKFTTSNDASDMIA